MSNKRIKFIFFLLVFAQISQAELREIMDISPEPSTMTNIHTVSTSATAPSFQHEPEVGSILAQNSLTGNTIPEAAPIEMSSSEMDETSSLERPDKPAELMSTASEVAVDDHATPPPQSVGYNGIQEWFQNAAFPALQNVQNYATETLVPAAQDITQTVSDQAKETGKSVVSYMKNTLVPSLKDVVGRVGQTLVSWSNGQEGVNNSALDSTPSAQPSTLNDTPLI